MGEERAAAMGMVTGEELAEERAVAMGEARAVAMGVVRAVAMVAVTAAGSEAARAVARAAGSAAAGSEAARLAEVSEEARFAPLCRRSLRRMREQEQRGQIGGTPLYSRMKRFLTSVCNLRDAAGCSLRDEGAT